MVEQCHITVILIYSRDDIVTVCCNSVQVILALVAIVLVILGRRRLLHLVMFVVMLQAIVLIFLSAMMVRSLSIPLTQTEGDIKEEINKQLYQTLQFNNTYENLNDPINFDNFIADIEIRDAWRIYMDMHLCCGLNGHSDYRENIMVPIQCQCYCTNISEFDPFMVFKWLKKVHQIDLSVVHECTQYYGDQCEPELLQNLNITVAKGQPGCSKQIAREYHELFSFVEHVKTIVVTSVAWLHLLTTLVHFCIYQNHQ